MFSDNQGRRGPRSRRASRRQRLVAAFAGLALAAGMAGVVSAGPARAAILAFLYFRTSDQQSFGFTGGEQDYTIPAGATALLITAIGAPAGGGISDPAAGGFGADVSAVVPVSALPAGTLTLYVEVGGAGQDASASSGTGASAGKCTDFAPGGFNGGGSACNGGGGGGGASDVRTTSIAAVANSDLTASTDSRIVVAGGGGGGGPSATAGTDCTGGTAGDNTVTGPGNGGDGSGSATCSGTDGGFGGTSGGTGGTSDGTLAPGQPGQLGTGGGGTSGGGGGYLGGGGGGCCTQDAAGGAGSSYWIPAASDTSMSEDSTGSAEVTITPGFDDTESLTQPANIQADATGPDGATVDYPLPTATDAAGVVDPVVECTPGSGTVFPIGPTEVTCTATDPDASPSSVSVQFDVTVQAVLSIAQPPGVTVNATGPGGAAATYQAPAVSDPNDPGLTATCTPASGTVFAIGTTQVTCSAADPGATPTSASIQFTVTVNGAAAQLTGLDQAVQGLTGAKALSAILASAQSAVAGGKPNLASLDLAAFVAAVALLRATHAIPAATAQSLTATAVQILAVLGH
jgi:hypothetical protein